MQNNFYKIIQLDIFLALFQDCSHSDESIVVASAFVIPGTTTVEKDEATQICNNHDAQLISWATEADLQTVITYLQSVQGNQINIIFLYFYYFVCCHTVYDAQK